MPADESVDGYPEQCIANKAQEMVDRALPKSTTDYTKG